MVNFTRRKLLLLGGAAALGATACGYKLLGGDSPFGATSPLRAALPLRVTHTAHALGTKIKIDAIHADGAIAESAIDDALAEIERIESIMSIYRPDSQLSQLNRTGLVAKAEPEFVEVLTTARSLSEQSLGAFDVTVQPLWRLFAAAGRENRIPDAEEIEAARQRVDFRQLQVSGRRVTLTPTAAITLNGIAQGFALDRAMAVLSRCGVEHVLIDTGEIGAHGQNEKGQTWAVGVQHPRQADALAAVLSLDGRCLATSGDYATTFSKDNKYNHLFDPRPQSNRVETNDELASVSVLAPSGMLADGLSTAVFVLGANEGAKLIAATPGADALLITKTGRSLATPGFPA